MAEPEAQDELEPVFTTNEEKLEYWQTMRVILDYRRQNISRKEAVEQYAYWTQLPPVVASMMFSAMKNLEHKEIMLAFPKWITKDKEPKFDDQRKATRAGNFLRRQSSGVDAVGRGLRNLGG